MSNTPKPFLSVCMITYMQEMYLEKAIEGILIQEINFEIELVISDDHSTDKTENIVKFFMEQNPKGNWIKYFRQEKNIGMIPNFEYALNQCSGKYIATCEGDDYWTDPFKLQKQVDLLEANSDVVLCYHPVNVLFPDGRLERDYLFEDLVNKSESNIYDLATLGNYIHTPSVVFRNVLDGYPGKIKESPVGDYFLWMVLAQHGKIKKLQDVMAVYRYGVGIHSTQNDSIRINSFKKTLKILSETIKDKTIVEILKNRIDAIKISTLPDPVKALDNYGDSIYAEVFKDYIGLDQLIKAIWLKIKRRFS